MPDLNKIFLYRITHLQNIPHILHHGITHIESPNRNPDYFSIGDSSLISARSLFVLPNNRNLGDYIPFYFGPRMPMLYVTADAILGFAVFNNTTEQEIRKLPDFGSKKLVVKPGYYF